MEGLAGLEVSKQWRVWLGWRSVNSGGPGWAGGPDTDNTRAIWGLLLVLRADTSIITAAARVGGWVRGGG